MRRLLLALSVLSPLTAQEITPPERYAAVRDEIRSAVAEGKAVGVAIAVLEDGDLIWAEGFGQADRELGTPATADTIFRLASISKPFTATAAMLLVESGQLDLDAPVNDWLAAPGLVVAHAGDSADITLRRLMNHTAGLPTHWNFYYAPALPPPREQTIARYGFAAWRPGTRTVYSNLAFGIVDHVIARVSGTSYRRFLVEEILDPLGMTHTDVGVRPGKEAHAAAGYRRDAAGRWVRVADYGFDHDGASAVRSSARDLMRFARLWIDDGLGPDGVRVLAQETVRHMQVCNAPVQDGGVRYGVGWRLLEAPDGSRELSHTGGMPGVQTVLGVYPERRSAIAVLANASTAVRMGAFAHAEALLFGVDPPPAFASEPREAESPREWPAIDLELAGEVAHPDGPIAITIHIEREPDEGGTARVTTRLPGLNTRREVERFDPSHFTVEFPGYLHTRDGVPGGTTLLLELGERGAGYGGVLWVIADGVFRLPHWVELRRVE